MKWMRGSTQRRCDRALGSPPGRARIGSTGRVPVELIVNGYAVQELELEADGTLQAPAHEGRVCILLSGWTYLAPEHIF